MRYIKTTDSILHSTAQALLLPVPADGVLLSQSLIRLLQHYPQELAVYKQKASKGVLRVGQLICLKTQRQTTGLAVGSNRLANFVLFLVTHHHHTHTIKPSVLTDICKQLQDKLFDAMRYDNLRHCALYLPRTRDESLLNDDTKIPDIEHLWQIVQDNLSLSRMRMDAHFAKI